MKNRKLEQTNWSYARNLQKGLVARLGERYGKILAPLALAGGVAGQGCEPDCIQELGPCMEGMVQIVAKERNQDANLGEIRIVIEHPYYDKGSFIAHFEITATGTRVDNSWTRSEKIPEKSCEEVIKNGTVEEGSSETFMIKDRKYTVTYLSRERDGPHKLEVTLSCLKDGG